MKLKIFIALLANTLGLSAQQEISDFISITPAAQNSNFVIPNTHTFQKIIAAGDPLTEGGTFKVKNDFTGYVPINGSSENGYLSINSESAPGGVTVLDINFNNGTKLWQTSLSKAVDFSGVVGTLANCSGTVTAWNTVISCEEWVVETDLNLDGHNDNGWCIEIDPATKMVIDKLWALGNFKHENVTIHDNGRTLYQGIDDVAGPGYLYKFVADNAEDLGSGNLYVYTGPKDGSGNWVQINNSTPAERNNTVAQSTNVGATIFAGIEDVEIGPDGWVYFAVKNEARVYRFQDSDPITGTIVTQVETYVGDTSYPITHAGGTTNVNWGNGNDNLAFDDQGNLWVMQDGGSQNYIWVVENGHTQLSPKVRIFGNTPLGSEPTGITFSPDYRFLFMAIQHPDTNNSGSQIDAANNPVIFNKGTTVVVARNEYLGTTPLVWYLDFDQDGYAAPTTVTSVSSPGPGYTTTVLPTTDCDDNDANINPDTVWYLDFDNDGYAASTTTVSCTNPGAGYTTNVLPTTDCNDNDASVNAITTWYLDADGDGFADPNTLASCNSPGTGYTTNVLPTTDCDDNDASVNAITTWYLDADGDGFAAETTVESCGSPGLGYTENQLPTTDCNDNDASINAIATWYLDADGDGFADPSTLTSCNSPGTGYTTDVLPTTDCNDNDPSVSGSATWYLDADGDGFADPNTIASCNSPGTGYTTDTLPTTDCDDNDASVNTVSTWYLDTDGDGFAAETTVESCGSPGQGYTKNQLPTTDCNDNDALVSGSATWYLDADGDGFADPNTIASCNSPGTGYTTDTLPTTDCDDNDASVNAVSTWYLDADGDGFAAETTMESCGSPSQGYSETLLPTSDCDDNDILVNQITTWYLDADNDGFADSEPIMNCGNPGTGYTSEVLPPKISPDGITVLYPNPTTESIQISLGRVYQEIAVSLVNLLNQSIRAEKFVDTDEISMNLSIQESGIYLLQITSEGKTVNVLKVIKQ